MNYNRYKDRDPIESIEKAKELLSLFELEYKESEIINNPVRNVFSTRIYVPSLNIRANGKGTTKEYCLASGYGELLERIFNIHFHRFYTSKYHYFRFFL